MTTNYADLKEKAEAATQGPWEAINDTVENDSGQMIAHVMTSKYSATYKPDGSIEHIGDAVDAEFIAAFNPAVALELIARLERAEKSQVPEGYALVPIEPTYAMLNAKPKPMGAQGQCVQSMRLNADRAKYIAMVEAAMKESK